MTDDTSEYAHHNPGLYDLAHMFQFVESSWAKYRPQEPVDDPVMTRLREMRRRNRL